jgi:hypothetical protein
LVLPTALKLTPADRALLGPPLALIVGATAVTYPLRAFRAALVGLQDVAFAGTLAVCEIAVGALIVAGLLIAKLRSTRHGRVVPSTLMVLPAPRVTTSRRICREVNGRYSRSWTLLRNGIGVWFGSFGWQLLSASSSIVIISGASRGGRSATAVGRATAMQLGWCCPIVDCWVWRSNGELPRSPRLKQMVGALVQLHLLLSAWPRALSSLQSAFVTWWVGEAASAA